VQLKRDTNVLVIARTYGILLRHIYFAMR
jgi:hypothetical protein